MHKLLQFHGGKIYSTLKNCFEDPQFHLPILHSHGFSKTSSDQNLKLDFIFSEVEALKSAKPTDPMPQLSSKIVDPSVLSGPRKGNESTVQISHPWPEWVDLMELLLKRGYLEAEGNPFQNGELGFKETNSIRTACLNFARDRSGLVRFLSRKDINVIAGCGCPSIDRKVVNSGKRLRAHVGIDEGKVCSSCNLRGDCERAYVKAREDEGGRTVDVMRFLLTYGLDSVSATSENKLYQIKLVRESVRRLLKEMVEYSDQQLDTDLVKSSSNNWLTPQEKGHIDVPMKQGDWFCPECKFLNFARNVKCLRCNGLFQERLNQLREDRDHLPLKKGDWICEKCNFLNFAKNTRCLQCKEKPPKRHLNPGEWECESCNYINFRRNMVCLKCDHRRPKASNASKASVEHEHGNVGHSSPSSLRFHRQNEAGVDEYLGLDGTNVGKGAYAWRFVEEESKSNRSIAWNEDSRFVDFPIVGGKSKLSQNSPGIERWKLEMLEGKGAGTKKNDEDDGDANTQKLKLHESSDDEEMADWFGHEKKCN